MKITKGPAFNPSITLYRLPRARIRRCHDRLDWIDEYESIQLDAVFYARLIDIYRLPPQHTNEIVAADSTEKIDLYRWNGSLAIIMTGGDPDVFEGLVGGDSPLVTVQCCNSWMTQRQAWHLWSFFRDAISNHEIVVELRVRQDFPTAR